MALLMPRRLAPRSPRVIAKQLYRGVPAGRAGIGEAPMNRPAESGAGQLFYKN